jgi:hypothetical protein
MPDMDGVEFLELSQQLWPNAVRIMITGNSDEQSVIAAINRAGLFTFIRKPVEPEKLQEALESAYKQFQKEEAERIALKKAENPDLLEHPSWLHKIDEQLRNAFKEIPVKTPKDSQFENWSILIHLAMSAEKRYYHNTHHLFDIWDVKDAYMRLAILFHDVVYAQVDKKSARGILPQIQEILGPKFIPNDELKLICPEPAETGRELLVRDIYDIFGLKPGSELTHMTGLNEFLSAFVAQHTLKDTLDHWDILKVMSCIELTIPFRGKDKDGKTAADRLFDRIKNEYCPRNASKRSDQEIEAVVKRAVECANRDVWSFAAKDPGEFLNGSWQLILESNPSLQAELHTPKEYRSALQKMEGFFGFLTPEKVYQRFNDYPNSAEYAELMSQTNQNLESGKLYFRAKIMAMAILESLDELTGGRAPIEIFRGDIESVSNKNTLKLESFLDFNISLVEDDQLNVHVRELLKVTSNTKIRYDLRNSPLAFYTYERVSKKNFESSFLLAQEYFNSKFDGFSYLKSFPPNLMRSILEAIAQVSATRRNDIQQIAMLLEK